MFVQRASENIDPKSSFGPTAAPCQVRVSAPFDPPVPVLLAVQPFDLKVGVEVEDNALRGLRRRDDPVTVLVRRVLQGITGGSDVAGLAGIQDTAAL